MQKRDGRRGGTTLDVGRRAERKAAWFYRWRLFWVVERNWRGGGGEIDLIVRRGRLLVFVEVRFRGSGSLAASHETIDRRKQRLVIDAAASYLANQKDELDVRFDVIAFDTPRGGSARMRHYPDAFRPEADPRLPWLRRK